LISNEKIRQKFLWNNRLSSVSATAWRLVAASLLFPRIEEAGFLLALEGASNCSDVGSKKNN
jgi:hypothetical protein